MAVLPLVTGVDNKILRKVSAPVKKIDKTIKKLVADMLDTVIDCDGLGIAAPQVGHNLRIYIARLNFDSPHEMWVPMLNAEILETGKRTTEKEEGCLSLPGRFGTVSRASKVTVKYMDLKGNSHTLYLEDLNARVMQHEMDHLNATLIADKMIQEVAAEEMKSRKKK